MSDPAEDRSKAAKLPEGDVLAILYRQHADITEALDRVTNSKGAERKANFESIKSFLTAHETAEQKIIRPVVEENGGTSEAQARNAEEKKADAAVTELSALDVDSNAFSTKFSTFKTSVSDHAESEENDEFPLLEARSDAERLELGRKFLDAQAAATT